MLDSMARIQVGATVKQGLSSCLGGDVGHEGANGLAGFVMDLRLGLRQAVGVAAVDDHLGPFTRQGRGTGQANALGGRAYQCVTVVYTQIHAIPRV